MNIIYFCVYGTAIKERNNLAWVSFALHLAYQVLCDFPPVMYSNTNNQVIQGVTMDKKKIPKQTNHIICRITLIASKIPSLQCYIRTISLEKNAKSIKYIYSSVCSYS